MTNETHQPPAPGEGDTLPLKDLIGALLLFDVKEEKLKVETEYGETSAIVCSVAALDGDLKGQTFNDVWVFGVVLKGQLRGAIGDKMLGRLGQGENKRGNPPWLLNPGSDDDRATSAKYEAHIASQAPVVEPESEEPF